MQQIDISAKVFTPGEDDEIDGQTHTDQRYEFTLFDSTGQSYQFIVDLPNTEGDENDSVDVWLVDSTVQIGDSPEDGFATFTPNKA